MNINLANPFEVIFVLVGITLMPFLAVVVTSFTKIIVVLGLLRNALGLQSTPPNLVLNGLSIILSFYIMSPVLQATGVRLQQVDFSNVTLNSAPDKLEEISGPMRAFLETNASAPMKKFFHTTAKRVWPAPYNEQVKENDIAVLIPAFVVTELTYAFQIGFIIYLPFVIIDLVVSNILMALGIVMIAPTTISLPFKLLLFSLVDGWRRLLEGLIATYTMPPM